MRRYKKDHPDKPIRNFFYSLLAVFSALVFAGGFILLDMERQVQAGAAFAFCIGMLVYLTFVFLKSKNR